MRTLNVNRTSETCWKHHRLYRVGHISHVIFLPAAIEKQLRVSVVLGQGNVERLLVNEEIPPQHSRTNSHEQAEQGDHPVPEVGIAPIAEGNAFIISERNGFRGLGEE